MRNLVSGEFSAGVHHYIWNAKDDAGMSVSTGLYVYRLTAGNRVLEEKTILAK